MLFKCFIWPTTGISIFSSLNFRVPSLNVISLPGLNVISFPGLNVISFPGLNVISFPGKLSLSGLRTQQRTRHHI